MSVYGGGDVLRRSAELHCEGDLVDEVGGVRPHYLGAEHLVGPGVDHQLHEAAVLSHCHRFPERPEGEAAHVHLDALLGGLVCVEPDTSYLWCREYAGRHDSVVHRRVPAGCVLSRHQPLEGRYVGEHYTAHNVADGVDASYIGFHLSLIHISEPTRLGMISYAVFCLKKKKKKNTKNTD